MNPLLELHKPFESRPGTAAGGPARIPTGATVTADKLTVLANELQQAMKSWPERSLIGDNILIETHYRSVVAKSNRMTRLLRQSPDMPLNRCVVGARFGRQDDGSPYHILTYCVSKETVENGIDLLNDYARHLRADGRFNGSVSSEALDLFNKGKQTMPDGMYKTEFAQVIKDSHYVKGFTIPRYSADAAIGSFITLFDTGLMNAQDLMDRLGIDETDYQIIDRLTLIANNETVLTRIRQQAPYLVSMSVTGDFSQEPVFEPKPVQQQALLIPPPSNEPTVGVIDTGFDEDVYFTDWVDAEDRLRNIDMLEDDMMHGTEVSSIIVDGPALNPWLEDGCGRFKVRHFTVARDGNNSVSTILKEIESIVKEHLDIKVWNLSLGTDTEVSEHYISPIAALLDRLQFDYDVLFVVAGTNLPKSSPVHTNMRIGSPADSINSIVVNSCNRSGMPASYTRHGPALEFFRKPDIAYYGGDKDMPMYACTPRGIVKDTGTSLAAPWITRKIAYLIHVMGFSRQTAKALLIDAAATWRQDDMDNLYTQGFGIPPIHIDDILTTANNEIRFIVSDTSELYETYQYQLPVPIDNKGRHPFMARATLCYFPECNRHQGVDYTRTELDLHFGRIKPPSSKKLEKHPDAKPTVESINGNMQSASRQISLSENSARSQYRKWDNVKHISDVEKSRFTARKTYTPQGYWGMALLAKERWERMPGEASRSLRFSIVVTLREMEGRNRIEDFKQQCMAWGWAITSVTVENRIDIYNEGEQEITFE